MTMSMAFLLNAFVWLMFDQPHHYSFLVPLMGHRSLVSSAIVQPVALMPPWLFDS